MGSILITAALVSLDAIFVGMSLKQQRGFQTGFLFVIAAIILALCIPAFFVAGLIAEHISFSTSWVVGAAFVLLGVRSLFDKDEDTMTMAIGPIVLLGLVMSIDGIVATVALTIDQGSIFLTPVLMPAGHLLFLFVGSYAARHIRLSHKYHNIISASCLFLVAMLNFAEIL